MLGFGPIKAIDSLTDFNQCPLVKASLEPNIPVVAKFIRAYTKPEQTPTGGLLNTNSVPQGLATTQGPPELLTLLPHNAVRAQQISERRNCG